MKIAYVYDAVYPWVKGGAEKRVYELSRRLADRGHEVHCFGIKWWKGDSVIQRDGVFLHGICESRNLYSGDRRSMREALVFAWKVLLSLKGDYDLLIYHLSKGRPLIAATREDVDKPLFHYVVVAGIDRDRSFVLLNDPAQRKLVKLTSAEFGKAWSGTNNWTLLVVPENPCPR